MTVRPRNSKSKPSTYEPSDNLKQAEKAMDDALEAYEAARHAYRKAIADELRTTGLSQGKMAQHTPYTEPTVRDIAREYGVPPKRKPTVRPLKD